MFGIRFAPYLGRRRGPRQIGHSLSPTSLQAHSAPEVNEHAPDCHLWDVNPLHRPRILYSHGMPSTSPSTLRRATDSRPADIMRCTRVNHTDSHTRRSIRNSTVVDFGVMHYGKTVMELKYFTQKFRLRDPFTFPTPPRDLYEGLTQALGQHQMVHSQSPVIIHQFSIDI